MSQPEQPSKPGARGDLAAALAALRAAAPAAPSSEPDEKARALAALRGAAPAGPAAPPQDAGKSAALDALRAAAPAPPAAAPATSDALAKLRAAGQAASSPAPSPDDRTRALAALKAAAPAGVQATDDSAAALAALKAAAPAGVQATDDSAAALAALRAAAPAGVQATDDAAAALAALRAAAPAGVQASDDAAAALLASDNAGAAAFDDLDALLGAAAVDGPMPDTADKADRQASAAADAAAVSDPQDDLDALLAGPADDGPQDGTGDDLDALPAAPAPAAQGGDAAEVPDLADPLDDLDALLAGPADDGPQDAAADDLDALLAAPAPAAAQGGDAAEGPDLADPLDDLDALLAADVPPAAAGGGPAADAGPLPAAEVPEEPYPEDPLAALEALLSDPPSAALGSAPDPLDELEALLAPEAFEGAAATAGGDDGLDALLATPAAAAAAPARAAARRSAFGTLSATAPHPAGLVRPVFRIAVFGDFTGRALRGGIETGARLAERRATRLDVDTLDDVIERFATTLALPVGPEGQAIEVRLKGLDSLHPDELVENVAIFDELRSLRMRLASPGMAAKAVAEMQGWGGAFPGMAQPTRSRSAAAQVPADLRLSDFERLIGAAAPAVAPSPAADMIARIVGPHILPGAPPEAKAMQKQVEAAMTSALRLILHHPDFQAIEAAWRTLDLLARSIETDEKLTVDVFDVSAAEFAADLAAQDDLARSGVFRILNAPLIEEGGNGYSAAFGLYTFEETPPHAELLARAAQIAAHVQAPFVAAMGPAFLDVARGDRHPLVAHAWDTLRAEPAAAWLGLAAPRFLLRQPYGRRSDAIDAFDFEEFTMAEGLSGMLWCNPAALVAILLARAWKKDGPRMTLGGQMSLGGIPYFVVTDRHGDQVALPCTERNVTTEKAEAIVQRGMMPVVSVRGRDVVRLGAFQSLAGQMLEGRWSGNPPPEGEGGDASERRPTLAASHRRAPPPAAAGADALADDLDALLAGFGDTPAPADPAAIDADLAALLEGL